MSAHTRARKPTGSVSTTRPTTMRGRRRRGQAPRLPRRSVALRSLRARLSRPPLANESQHRWRRGAPRRQAIVARGAASDGNAPAHAQHPSAPMVDITCSTHTHRAASLPITETKVYTQACEQPDRLEPSTRASCATLERKHRPAIHHWGARCDYPSSCGVSCVLCHVFCVLNYVFCMCV